MLQTINTLINATKVTQDPRVVLKFLLKEESGGDNLGWERSVLVGHAATMIDGSPDETLEIAEGGLKELLKVGEVVTAGMLIKLP